MFFLLIIAVLILGILGIDLIPMVIFVCTVIGLIAILLAIVNGFMLEKRALFWLILGIGNFVLANWLDTSGVKICLWNIFFG